MKIDPATCELIVYRALAEGDIRGVDAALRVMASQDPQRAQELIDLLKLALALSADTENGSAPPR